MSIVQKIIIWFLGLTLIPTLLVGGLLYFGFRNHIISQAVAALQYQATVQQGRVQDVVAQNSTQLEGFTSRVLLPLTLDHYNRTHQAADLTLLSSTIATAKAQTPKYNDISILDLNGEVIASTVAGAVGQDYSAKNYFAEAQVHNNSTDFLFVDAKGQLDINLVGPIMYQNNRVGIVVIDASAANLQTIATDYSGFGATGETELAKSQGKGTAVYLAPLRFNKAATLQPVSKSADKPIVQALGGSSRTIFNTVNYRNKPVIAVTRPIAGTSWGLVVEANRAELYQPLYSLRDSLLLLTFVILVFCVFIALYAARLITDPIITLSIAANAMSKGDLSQRVEQDKTEADDGNELNVLAHSFNSMASNLEQLDKMKTEFILLTSHQLRTPASAVKGFLSLLLEGYAKPLSAKQKELIVAAYAENEQQLRLVNQILSISQAESDQMAIDKSTVDLGKLAQEVAEQLRPIALEHKQKITLHVPKPALTVPADPEKMHMVIENLVSNALKYSPDKTEVTITVEREPRTAVITVQDHGYGVASDDMGRLFKKFSRVSNPKSVVAQGSGLGLYLVKLLVTLHSGTIDVQSTPNKGTTFIVRLPYS